MPFSLRLDPDTEARIRKLTATTGRSKADVVRDAVEHYAVNADAAAPKDTSAFDRLRVYGLDEDGIVAFTDEGVDELINLLEIHRENADLPK